ncbi:MAG TPA: acyl-CoA dehydrogenase family protein [Caldimonas sp.]|jgi:alkylation response protein AidB-like acyl-CoA dehydrogenase|nr:acyl-CoA dehydrogenase family protein [Caldimonas sp.]HEX2540161.1 acyl-CoA dehydrogenase family protein [Caldimonas sp.]
MNELSAPFERLLADACTPEVVREVERGGTASALWSRIAASGFLDALVPEAAGGAGLRLADVFPLFVSEGRHALPVPVAHTLLARAALAAGGAEAPDGPIAIATHARSGPGGAWSCPGTPCGRVAEWVAVASGTGWMLLPTARAVRRGGGVHGSLRADLDWAAPPDDAVALPVSVDWAAAGAALAAAQLAGAMQRVLQQSVAFANERVQFGRSIGKFQSIQHQLAVMAEHVTAAHMAAEIGCAGAGPLPDPLRAALAKARASEAAVVATATAHAVHGAIGVTAELDLQLFTRRIHEWRADFGAETHWNRVLGRALLASDAPLALDFMRSALIPRNEDIRP